MNVKGIILHSDHIRKGICEQFGYKKLGERCYSVGGVDKNV